MSNVAGSSTTDAVADSSALGDGSVSLFGELTVDTINPLSGKPGGDGILEVQQPTEKVT